MTRRFDIGPVLVAVGALILLVGLFLDWYGGLNAWNSFELADVLLAVLAVAGLALFIFGPALAAAFFGVLLWGAGTSLGFPTGMSAAADDPARAAPRVGVVASVGYCAFLGGPPLIGFLGDHIEVRQALLCVVVLLAVAATIAGALRPPHTDHRER